MASRSSSLPEELIEQIFSYLHSGDPDECSPDEARLNRRTLLSACLTCRDLCRIARPVLYDSFDLRSLSRKSIRPFLQTLLCNPPLAPLVRVLRLKSWERDVYNGSEKRVGPPSPDLLPKYLAACEDLALSNLHEKCLKFTLPGSCDDAELALVVARCTNLEVLDVDVPSWAQTSLLFEYLGSIAHTSKIHSLVVDHHDNTRSAPIKYIESILRLQSLRALRGYMIDCTHYMSFSGVDFKATLRSIHLWESRVDGEGLGKLLSICPALETLAIEWGPSPVVGLYVLSFNTIGQALRKYSRNLRRFTMDTWNYDGWGLPTNLGDLSPLPHLQELTIPSEAIFSVDRETNSVTWAVSLPPSLLILEVDREDEMLGDDRVTAPGEDVDSLFVMLMTSRRHARLKRIHLHQPDPFTKHLLPCGWCVDDVDQSGFVLKRQPGL